MIADEKFTADEADSPRPHAVTAPHLPTFEWLGGGAPMTREQARQLVRERALSDTKFRGEVRVADAETIDAPLRTIGTLTVRQPTVGELVANATGTITIGVKL